jgi:EAL domain-containing protein (putative c-di-GMP-specific phosphodiesterase class I)
VIDTDSFRPVFQPFVRLRDRQVSGYEALTRFTDGTPPDAVFTEATHLSMGVELELATLRAAVAAARFLPPDRFVSINGSPALVVGAIQELRRLLQSSDQLFVLEITEHDRVDDYGVLLDLLELLRPRVRLSIDDAGSGFSSLRHVLTLRPDFVKLDQSWVRNIEADPSRQALVAGLAHFARATRCVLIAEGIETEAELHVVDGLGVEFGQGFLFGHPADVA